VNISVKIGKAKFQNPVTVASGTFEEETLANLLFSFGFKIACIN